MSRHTHARLRDRETDGTNQTKHNQRDHTKLAAARQVLLLQLLLLALLPPQTRHPIGRILSTPHFDDVQPTTSWQDTCPPTVAHIGGGYVELLGSTVIKWICSSAHLHCAVREGGAGDFERTMQRAMPCARPVTVKAGVCLDSPLLQSALQARVRRRGLRCQCSLASEIIAVVAAAAVREAGAR